MFLFSCAHALCLFHLCYAYRTRVNQSLGLGRNGQKIVYFANKSVTSFLRKVLPMIFRSTKVCQGLPNLKQAVVLPRSRAKFRQAWNLTELSIYIPWFWRKMSIMKFDLYEVLEYFSPKPAKIIHICAAIKRWRWKVRTSVCCMTIVTQNTAITVPKFTLQRIFRAKYCSIFTFLCKSTKYTVHCNICMQTIRVNRVRVQALVVNKYFAVSQCAHAWQIEKFGRDKFCRDFCKGQTNFVSPVRRDPYTFPFLMTEGFRAWAHCTDTAVILNSTVSNI